MIVNMKNKTHIVIFSIGIYLAAGFACFMAGAAAGVVVMRYFF